MRDATLSEWLETSADAVVGQFEEVLAARSGSFAERETAALSLANAIVRQWTQRELQRLADRYDEEVIVDGRQYRRHATGTLRYHTLCGRVDVRRDTYRMVGVHNGPTIVPLELEAGIQQNATPALVLSVVQAFAMMPLRDYEDEMRAAHRVVPSRSTLERISKRVGREIHEHLPVIEPILRAEEKVSPAVASVSVGIDRTTIPMAEAQEPLPERWQKKRHRRPPPPVTVAYRMGYVATVALNDSDGNTISSKRIAATAEEGPIEMMERLGAEIQQLLEQRRRCPVVVVQDGAPELWNLVEEWFANFSIPIEMKLVDRYHVTERLAQIAEIIERDKYKRWRLLDEWNTALDRSDDGIRRICKQIIERTWGKDAWSRNWRFSTNWRWDRPSTLGSANARLVEGHLVYYSNQIDKTCYATALRRGYPIGSGVTEGACKSVIASRMKRSGQRWFESGASACLQVRTLYLNRRLDRALALHRDLSRRDLGAN